MFEQIVSEMTTAESARSFRFLSSAHTADELLVSLLRQGVFAVYAAGRIVGFGILFASEHPNHPLFLDCNTMLLLCQAEKKREKESDHTRCDLPFEIGRGRDPRFFQNRDGLKMDR